MKKLFSFYKKILLPPYHLGDLPHIILPIILIIATFFVSSLLSSRFATDYQSLAQTITNSIEPESGTATGDITSVSDPAASGGKYILLGSVIASPTPTSTLQQDAKPGVYPYGDKFALGLLSMTSNWTTEAARGWDVCHSYSISYPSTSYQQFMDGCRNAGMLMFGKLRADGNKTSGYIAKSEADVASDIAYFSSSGNLSWWDLPEEMRYWITSEMDVVKKYPVWIRKYDPNKYPIEMYIPGHYSKDQIQTYVPYLDIIPVSAYASYQGFPHTYVRWAIERTFQAIKDAGYTIGRDYLSGQKTVMSILELYQDKPGMSPQGSTHDFWLSLALDVKGIYVYSYAYRNSTPNLTACWTALSQAVANFTSQHIDDVMLRGTTDPGIGFTITSGPPVTDPLTSPSGGQYTYPSLTVLGKKYNGSTYVISVNSNTSSVSATITGLSAAATSASVLFENREISVVSGAISDSFSPLGVHVYKLNN